MDRAFAGVYDTVMGPAEQGPLGRLREQLLAGLDGHVVDLGAGTGANLRHLPRAVTRVTLVEPTPEMAARLRARLAEEPGTDAEVTVVEAPAEALPLDDASVDHVVATLVLCTVADPRRAIAEARRVLRPGGSLVVLEHVAADGVAGGVQRVLQPAWQVVARGCQLHRDTRALLTEGGFDTSAVVDTTFPGPRFVTTAIAGVAHPVGPTDG